VDDARAQAHQRIQTLDPYAYVNLVEAQADDIVNLTAGGIHHSWEQDDLRYPDGNLVYEVQLDVPDDLCSMRGFDKGKFLDDGSIRATHVADYLQTIVQDPAHNDLSRHIRRPLVMEDLGDAKTEMLFHTPYFNLDRVMIASGGSLRRSLAGGFHHAFVHQGEATVGDVTLEQGRSYVIPAALGEYTLKAGNMPATLLLTYLPVK
jgi:mannose-6-phosphate isomerase class I